LNAGYSRDISQEYSSAVHDSFSFLKQKSSKQRQSMLIDLKVETTSEIF